MIRRLLLVASLPEVGQRALRLPGGRDIERPPEGVGVNLRVAGAWWCGDDAPARAMANLLGLEASAEPLLAARDLGAWTGRSLVDLAEEDGPAVRRFATDLAFAPPAGETLHAVVERVRGWMDAVAGDASGRVSAVVDPTVVRAAVAVALVAGEVMTRVDVSPLSRTVLTHQGQVWRVRTIAAGRDHGARSSGSPLA